MAPNEVLVRRFFEEVWNQQRLDLADELVSPGYTVHVLGTTAGLQGLEMVRQGVRPFRGGFADCHDAIEDMFATGDRVAVRWRSSGTHTGPFAGVEPSGKTLTLTGVGLFRVESGRIAEHWSQADVTGLIERVRMAAS